jgi:hypothetical protein
MKILYGCEHCQCTLMAAAHDRHEFFCLGCEQKTEPVLLYIDGIFDDGPERETGIRDKPQG